MGKATFLLTALAFGLLLLAVGGWVVQGFRRPARAASRH
jgi:hypothetical protein